MHLAKVDDAAIGMESCAEGLTASGAGSASACRRCGNTDGMPSATITLSPDFRVGPVDPRLFGSFVEHMGRCVYTGIFEPGHPEASTRGFREDVLELVRELGPSLVRYPGGNFVSSYRWEDGVGPVVARPRRLDLAWHTIESNAFGIDEFMAWCAAARTEPMVAVNLGTRGVAAAAALLEYCNFAGGTEWSDMRRAHGRLDPYGVKVWCLGNELDGPWQVGHKTAWEYGRLAAETARAMRMVDPSIELVACGSSNSGMPTFASWEATVLAECHDDVDFISLHNYYEPHDGDVDSFLASSVDLSAAIKAIVATADHAAARLKSRKRLKVSVDEWNVWYRQNWSEEDTAGWPELRPLIEDRYDVVDAVVVGSLLIALLQHADRVGIACQAQLVNVIAPILTEPGGPSWRQTIFFPFSQVSRHARGEVLTARTTSPTAATRRYGDVPLVDTAATYDEETGVLAVFAINRHRSHPIDLDVDVRAFPEWNTVEATTLSDIDPTAHNTRDEPDRVSPRRLTGAQIVDGHLKVGLPPLSWTVLRLLR
jgi:alpha-L-arabinofuranosidase